jgi:hypothetical protein
LRRIDPVDTNEVDMGNVVKGLIVILVIWVGLELFTNGPSRAFNGVFADFFKADSVAVETRSTAQRAGDSVSRSQAKAEARRKRMLGE